MTCLLKILLVLLKTTHHNKWLKLKKVGKTSRPFKYDLNQIPYSYTVEVTNRFRGSNLDRQSALRTMDRGSRHCTGSTDQDHPQEKEIQKGKMVVFRGLTNSWEKKRSKRQRRKGKMLPVWMQSSSEKQGEIRKPSSINNAKKYRKTVAWKSLEIS